MRVSEYQKILERVKDYALKHYKSRIEKGVQSGTHGYRHAKTVESIAVLVAGNRRLDEKYIALLRISALLHDCIRLPGDIGQRDHAVESAKHAGKVLSEIGLSEEDIEIVTRAIAEHSDVKWSSEISEILWIADKVEQVAPFAPFRRAMFVGEHLRAMSLQPDEEVALEILIKYYRKRMRKLESFPKEGWKILDNLPELNTSFYRELEEKGTGTWVWEMSWFAIMKGYSNEEDIKAFKDYTARIERMKKKKEHRSYALIVRDYIRRWGGAV
ncbi:HD domain-containing protein [Archaeoglobus sp.]